MTDWVKWTLPATVIVSTASPVYAAAYLTLEEAQRIAFPTATRFEEAHVIFKPSDIQNIQKLSGQRVRARGQQVWKAEIGSQLIGYFILDYVIGKHLVIDYAVALSPDGIVKQVELIEYRESYGEEIHDPNWLTQFVGKTDKDRLEIDRDIRNISGATLSATHVTEGVKRLLAFYDVCLK